MNDFNEINYLFILLGIKGGFIILFNIESHSIRENQGWFFISSASEGPDPSL